MVNKLGIIALMGSGETSSAGGLVFEAAVRRLDSIPKIGILETPAGFELNTQRVAGRVAEYLQTRLQNYQPQIQLIPARKKNSPYSPDDPEICAGILTSNLIFFGPGSPTYTVRQLQGSLAWEYVQARQRLGACLALASAATIALGKKAIPVYEIYKVGEDPRWKDGLDFFAPYGLSMIIVPHWNNSEGGNEVDTSRCFIGQQRFEMLLDQLDEEVTVLGLDEHTGLIIDLESQECQVLGKGEIHVIRGGVEKSFLNDSSFSIHHLGNFHALADKMDGIHPENWQKAFEISLSAQTEEIEPLPPEEVIEALEQRRMARLEKNWKRSDQLRERISNLGWRVTDTSDGQKIERSN
jgi:hypothetical protein